VILKDDQGKTIVIPSKNISDKQIIIESGSPHEIQEKAVEENRGQRQNNNYCPYPSYIYMNNREAQWNLAKSQFE